MNTKEDKLNELALLLNIKENTLLSTENVLDILMRPIVKNAKECLDDGAMREFNILRDRCYQMIPSLVDDIVAYSINQYDRNFTEDEISSIVEFYRSPAGKRLIEVTPTLVKEVMELSVNVTKDLANEVFCDEDTDCECQCE